MLIWKTSNIGEGDGEEAEISQGHDIVTRVAQCVSNVMMYNASYTIAHDQSYCTYAQSIYRSINTTP